jgi:hypothetical protein
LILFFLQSKDRSLRQLYKGEVNGRCKQSFLLVAFER